MGLMLCNHCDAWVSTTNDAPRCTCCGERCCSRCLGKEKYTTEGVPPMKTVKLTTKKGAKLAAESALADAQAMIAATEATETAETQRRECEAARRREEELQRQIRISDLLTGHERTAISHGLRIAIETYQKAIEAIGSGHEADRLRGQFDRQIVEAEKIVDWLGD